MHKAHIWLHGCNARNGCMITYKCNVKSSKSQVPVVVYNYAVMLKQKVSKYQKSIHKINESIHIRFITSTKMEKSKQRVVNLKRAYYFAFTDDLNLGSLDFSIGCSILSVCL